MILLKTLLLVLLLGLGACSDEATRLAYDIESAALKLEASDKNSTEITHTMSLPRWRKRGLQSVALPNSTSPSSKRA